MIRFRKKELEVLPSPKALLRYSFLALVMVLISLQLFRNDPSCDIYHLSAATGISKLNGNVNNSTFLEHPHTSNLNYSWIGNHWIPPQGVPRYTPQQMKDIFSNLNILWTGDSISRQNMHTMFNVMDASDHSDITIEALDESLNENKKGKDRKCVDRDFSDTTVLGHNHDPYSFTCRNILGGIDTSNITTSPSRDTIPSKGKFDYSKSPCPDVLTQIAKDELNGTLTSLLNGYDWLVIHLGIWEVEKNWVCRSQNNTEPTRIRIDKTLNLMEQLASPRLSILWKTIGTVKNMSPSHIEGRNNLNAQVRQWFASRNPKHMYLLDFGKQMEPRSDDAHRIGGDSYAHWGWPARLLAIQMVTHAVVTLYPRNEK